MVGLFVCMVVLGCLLPAFGAMLIFSAIPTTSWDSSWAEIKEAFHIMFSKPRFQIGLVCFVLGVIVLLFLFLLLTP